MILPLLELHKGFTASENQVSNIVHLYGYLLDEIFYHVITHAHLATLVRSGLNFIPSVQSGRPFGPVRKIYITLSEIPILLYVFFFTILILGFKFLIF